MSESEPNDLAAALAAGEYEYVDVDELHEHPRNGEVYGELDPGESFTEDIRENGIETPLIANEHDDTEERWGLPNTVIGGHRRLEAARRVGLKQVPVRWQSYPEPLATIRLIKNNNQRDKTPGQTGKEIIVLEEEKRKAAKNDQEELGRTHGDPLPANWREGGEEGMWTERIAKDIEGVSARTVRRAADIHRFAYPDQYVHDDIPNPEKYDVPESVNEVAKQQIELMGADDQSFHGSLKAIKAAQEIVEMAQSVNADLSKTVKNSLERLKKPDVKPEIILDEVKAEKNKTESRRRAKKRREEFQSANDQTSPLKVKEGDFTDVLPQLDKTFDHIVTDPPYGEDAIETWNDLGRIAAEVLEPSGFLVAYSGKHHLPAVINSLGEHLKYFWQGVVVHKDAGARIWPRNIRTNYKPILIYQKPPEEKLPNLTDDVIEGGGAEKDDHEWQQATAEAIELVEKFTEPNDHIVDPMCGSGTTGVAALKRDRRVTLIDRDPEAVATAKRRCSNVL